jgi:hypothetical protein
MGAAIGKNGINFKSYSFKTHELGDTVDTSMYKDLGAVDTSITFAPNLVLAADGAVQDYVPSYIIY